MHQIDDPAHRSERRSTSHARFSHRLHRVPPRPAIAGLATAVICGVLATGAFAQYTHGRHRGRHERGREPIAVTVFSPQAGSKSGTAGVGFIVDLALNATNRKYNALLSTQAGYKPYFNDPSASTFHPGPDPGAPGLVVLLSTTADVPGTAFQGPNTNLAGLFQINGVATVRGLAETWSTWQPGKALFGEGPAKLTVYVVEGTAPAVISPGKPKAISNVVTVPFDIVG